MCAQDVDRALQLARKEMPGILLLDINLPSGNGINVHARLRSDPALRDIPVIYVTGERTEHTMAKAHKMGAYSVLYKPFNLDDLLMNVKSALRSFMTRQKGMRQLQSPGNAVSTHSQDSLEFKREERIWLQC
jgi:DNA-binding response OmpR family regulator